MSYLQFLFCLFFASFSLIFHRTTTLSYPHETYPSLESFLGDTLDSNADSIEIIESPIHATTKDLATPTTTIFPTAENTIYAIIANEVINSGYSFVPHATQCGKTKNLLSLEKYFVKSIITNLIY